MPDPILQNTKSFDENIELLFEEIELAIKWERPSILLAVHKSKFGQDKAGQALEKKLKKLGQNITQIVVNNEHPDVPHLIQATQPRDRTVFFVSNIDWGGGQDGKQAYRALNVYRELFVENLIKVVFWLTAGEASSLPRYAPDFWAFRHRVIEFAAQRTHGDVNLPSGILIWHEQNSIDPPDQPLQRIAAREEFLSKLPHTDESLSARVDLLYNIGYLYWVLGNSKKAMQAFTEGIDRLGNLQLNRARSDLLNGIGVIYFEADQFEKAVELFKEAAVYSPEDGSILINLSAACCALGRNQEAVTISKRAIKLDPSDALIWNRLGYIYCAMKKYDEAISWFLKAVDIAPQIPGYLESLAVSYCLIKRLDESKRILDAVRKSAGPIVPFRLDVYSAAFSNNFDKSLEILRNALVTDQITMDVLLRDPNLNILLSPAQIQELSG